MKVLPTQIKKAKKLKTKAIFSKLKSYIFV